MSANREREGQLANEVGPAERRERIDELVDDALHERLLPVRKQLGSERGRHERAMGAMLGLVHRDHRAVEHRAHDLAQAPRRVGLVVAQHGDHFVVAQDVDVRLAGRRLAADVERQRPFGLDRPPASGGGEVRVGILDAAELQRGGRIEQLEGRTTVLGVRHTSEYQRY